MTLDPQQLVNDVSRRSHDRAAEVPPVVLEKSADAPPSLAPVREAPQVATMHDRWARVHDGAAGLGASAGAAGAGVRAKVRARVVTAAAEATRTSQQDDRTLIGDLIRAVDALAIRSDELSERLGHLQSVVEGVIAALGADVVQLRAALASSGRLAGSAAEQGLTDRSPAADA
ncbi:MAG: hypothetical protein ACRDYZ_09725 [Acidimicrobiales bacterium]